MSAQHPQEPTDIRDVAQQAAITGSTPLARLVPSASAVADPSIDEWVERQQRRGRGGIKIGAAVLVAGTLATVLLELWL